MGDSNKKVISTTFPQLYLLHLLLKPVWQEPSGEGRPSLPPGDGTTTLRLIKQSVATQAGWDYGGESSLTIRTEQEVGGRGQVKDSPRSH